MSSRRRTRWTGVPVVVALVMAVLTLTPRAAPPAGATDTSVPMAYFKSIGVDPVSGRVFLAGDDVVTVFEADGTLVATIPNLPAAGGLDFDGGSLWVTETRVGRIAEIDLASLAVVREVSVGSTITRTSLAKIGTALWFVGDGQLQRYDLLTGTRTAKGPAVDFVELPWSPDELLLWSSADLSGRVDRVDTSTTPATVRATQVTNATLGQLLVDSNRRTFLFARQQPGLLFEVSVATMARIGVPREVGGGHTALALSADGRTIVVGGNSFDLLEAGVTEAGWHRTGFFNQLNRGLALSRDGTRLYVVTGFTDRPPKTLRVVDLTPVITAVSPQQIVAAVPGTTVRIDGAFLDMVRKVTIGGIEVPFALDSASLRVNVPLGLAAGNPSVVVTTRFGSASSPLTVLPNTGAVLSGAVKVDGLPRAGLTVTLVGDALAAPRVTTSGPSGTYTFAGVPYGVDYVLTTHDPSDAFPDQQMGPLTLVPNATATWDVLFRTPRAGTAALLTTTEIPIWQPVYKVLDPTTNRVLISGSGEVDAFDRDGQLRARIVGLGSVGALLSQGPDLFVVVAESIVRIDPRTLRVTAKWPVPTTPYDLVFAGGRLWFAGPDGLTSLDPSTGAVTTSSVTLPGRSQVRPLEGASDRFYVWSTPSTLEPPTGSIISVAGPAATVVAQRFDLGDAAGSLPLDRLWDARGRELRISDLQLTGVTFPLATPSYRVRTTPLHGGLVIFDNLVFRRTNAVPTHDTGGWPEFDATGDRVFQLGTWGLDVLDLKPRLTGSPTAVALGAARAPVYGTNLGAATEARIDGVTVPVFDVTLSSLSVPVASLPAGRHQVEVVTEWGVSTSTTVIVVPPPVIDAIVPSSVPTTGGTVTISGSGFTDASMVAVGGLYAPFTVVDDGTITANVPAHATGPGDVLVFGRFVRTSTSPAFAWTSVPFVAALDLMSGPSSGGSVTMISGSLFTGATKVMFGSVPATSFTVLGDASVVATAPPGAIGEARVTITTPFGTSAEAVTFTYRAASRFNDVPVGAPFFSDIEWAAERGITTGYPDGTFRPTGTTDRQSMAAFLYRYAGSPLGAEPSCITAPFPDVPTSSPFCGHIRWLKGTGITSGTADGTFRPFAPVDRQSMAAFVYRLKGFRAGAHPRCTEAPFPDVPVDAPFCGEIAWLKAAGVVTGYLDGGFHPTVLAARQATVAFLRRARNLRP